MFIPPPFSLDIIDLVTKFKALLAPTSKHFAYSQLRTQNFSLGEGADSQAICHFCWTPKIL
jgi:hypothetical protein